jgi:hypothetical protein
VVDRPEARVDRLEAENEALREQLAETRRSRDDLQGGPSSAETVQSTGSDSFWERLTSRFGATDE